MERKSRKPTTDSVIGYYMDYAMFGDADRQSWLAASLILPGYAFMNPSPPFRHGLRPFQPAPVLACSEKRRDAAALSRIHPNGVRFHGEVDVVKQVIHLDSAVPSPANDFEQGALARPTCYANKSTRIRCFAAHVVVPQSFLISMNIDQHFAINADSPLLKRCSLLMGLPT
ncbi:hypothetical protein Y032_0111g261 [Ancylostoma ceylanicum]|uniref:Uncharacterized protein n=1 Tax=Ancylostoma ceylanicum TaxID=53326 RepID=A0A016TEN7_9BILA|nr:hypothetical protein Y032_0111g261 [Ancylostoma ceylanicum]